MVTRSTKDGIKLLDNMFDGTPDKATFFQMKVIDVPESRFWAAVCKLEFNGKDIDVLKQPGKLTLDELKAHCGEIYGKETLKTIALTKIRFTDSTRLKTPYRTEQSVCYETWETKSLQTTHKPRCVPSLLL